MTSISPEARTALERLGIGDPQLQAFVAGSAVAFHLAGAADGTIAIAQVTPSGIMRVGIYTIKTTGAGLIDFLTFESRARAAAKALGAQQLELMGIEVTNAKLRDVLERGGFTVTTMPVPDELGGGTFTDVLSRTERVN